MIAQAREPNLTASRTLAQLIAIVHRPRIGAARGNKRMSVVSSTDVEIFRRLGNPEIVDANGAGNSTRQIAAQMRQAIEQAVASQRIEECGRESACSSENETVPQVRTSRLSEAVRAAQELAQLPPAQQAPPASPASAPATVLPAPVPAPVPALVLPAPPVQQAVAAQQRVDADARRVQANVPASLPVQAPREAPAQPPASPAAASDSEDEAAEAAPQRGAEGTRLEKQGYLIELQALQRKGVTLSRDFSMRDSIAELEFELQKQSSLLGTVNAVAFMRDTMRMAIHGLEIANSRLGPFLSLDGWADSMTGDMKRFDNALERLHKAYFRKKQMSPIMELAWVVLGSLVAHHFKAKFFGTSSRLPPQARPEPEGGSARAAAEARQPKAGASGRAPYAALRAKARPTLRPPSSMFGL